MPQIRRENTPSTPTPRENIWTPAYEWNPVVEQTERAMEARERARSQEEEIIREREYREHLLNIANMGNEIPQEAPERIPIHSVIRSRETNNTYYVRGEGETPDTFEITFFTNIFNSGGERQFTRGMDAELNRDDFYLLFTTDGESDLTREQTELINGRSTPPQINNSIVNPEQFEYIGRHPNRNDRENGNDLKEDEVSEKDFLRE